MGAFLIPAAVQGALGLGQLIFGGLSAAKASKQAEKRINAMTPDEGLRSYLQESMARYSADPMKSRFAQQQMQQAGRAFSTGLSAAQTRRGGLGAIGGLTQQYLDSSARIGSQAEQMGRQDFAQLGQATRMYAGEKQRVEDAKTNLILRKWAQRSQTMNQGLQNIFKGASTAAYGLSDGKTGKPGGNQEDDNTREG